MAFGVTDTYDVTVPEAACATEVRRSKRVQRFTVACETGTITRLRGGKMVEVDITVRGKGDPGFSAVTAGTFTVDVPKITAVEGTQVANGDYPEFEITAKMYENTTDTGGAAPSAPSGTAFQYGNFGITAISTSKVTRIRLRKTAQVGTPVTSETGTFSSNATFGILFEATVEGSGEYPAALNVGTAGAGIIGISGGVSLVETAEDRQETGVEQSWECSIVNAPSAT